MFGGVREDFDHWWFVGDDAFEAFGTGGEQVQGDDGARLLPNTLAGSPGASRSSRRAASSECSATLLFGVRVVERAAGHAARVVGGDAVVGGEVDGDVVVGGRAAGAAGDEQQERAFAADFVVQGRAVDAQAGHVVVLLFSEWRPVLQEGVEGVEAAFPRVLWCAGVREAARGLQCDEAVERAAQQPDGVSQVGLLEPVGAQHAVGQFDRAPWSGCVRGQFGVDPDRGLGGQVAAGVFVGVVPLRRWRTRPGRPFPLVRRSRGDARGSSRPLPAARCGRARSSRLRTWP